MHTVNRAFSGFHTDLAKLREDRHDGDGRGKLKDADTLLKQIRQAAVKAIHATGTCPDEDKDADEAHDTDTDTNTNDEHGSGDSSSSGQQSTITFQATDPAGIATEAVAMMQTVFNDATANLASPSTSPRPTDRRDDKGGHDKGHDSSDRKDDHD